MMKKRVAPIPVVVAMLSLLVLSCGILPGDTTLRPWSPTPARPRFSPTGTGSTPTPEATQLNYTNPATGVSIWYPEGWVYEEYLEEVIFASSPEIIASSETATGAAMMLSVSELDGRGTVEDLIETTLSELALPDFVTSDPKPRTIGGQQGVLVTLKGTPEGAPFPMKGFLAGVGRGDRGYVFFAVSVADQWSDYGSVLESMLGSVQFEAIEQIFASKALGLSMCYPEGWVYDEVGEEVIFGTSEEMISGAELDTGAAMLVVRSELEESSTVEDMFKMMVSAMPFEGLETSEPRSRAIDDEKGIMITFEGTPEGVPFPMKGFVVAAQYKGWGYLFLGISVVDEWCEHYPDLEAMLDSVQFTRE